MGLIKERQDELEAVQDEHITDDEPEQTADVDETPGETSREPPSGVGFQGSDPELIETAKNSKNGAKFKQLWTGDTSGYPSHSEADLALCSLLAFYTGPDSARIDRLFRQSDLVREKWTEREDYRERTIGKALAGRTEFYGLPENGDAVADTPDEGHGPGAPTWENVRSLFASDANGTTTTAYNQAAELICQNHKFVKIRESGAFYHYIPELGYYARKGETYIEEIINDNLRDHANENRRREIRRKVEGENYLNNDEFHPPTGKVNVDNGVLNLDTGELEDHSSEYYFTSQVRAEWPVDGQVDLEGEQIWLQALKDATDDPRERKKIEEFIGYCLETWTHDREKNLFLVGPRLSGKSTIQEAIEALFGGPPTVTNLTPQQIADTRFDAAALREAALNTVNDINARKIEDTGTLKRVFSGESMKLENKFEDAYFAAPTAKHLFTANWLPRLVGQDDAIYRRILIVEFTKTIDDDEKDRRYKKRLKRDAVRQVILKRAVEARERLHEQGGFTNDRSPNETRQIWDSWRDGHKRFLYTQFDITGDPEDIVDKRSYWQAYREFAARKGYEMKSNRAITDALQWVPEVYTNGEDDEYGGLKWLDFDAADREPGDVPEADQTTLDTQAKRVNRIRELVRDLSDDGGVERHALIDAAAKDGLDSEAAEHIVENLMQRGELYEPQSGVIEHV